MNLLLTISAVFSVIALYFVFSLLRHARRRRPIRATRSLAGGVVSGCAGAASIMLAFSYYGYERLVDEQLVGSIKFSESGPDDFVARVMIEGGKDQMFRLFGNEWQMDARVIIWKSPATLLGLDPIYQLDRISGRYSEIEEEKSRARTVYALSEPVTLDAWQFARKYPKLMPGVDAQYGTATYLPMAHEALYEVKMTRTGLIARPVDDAAVDAVGRWAQ